MYKKYNKYQKKNYYKKNYYRGPDSAQLITQIIVLGTILTYIIYWLFIKPNIEAFAFYGKITLVILFIITLFGIYYFLKKRNENKKLRLEKEENMPIFLLDLNNVIKSFKPVKYYNEEKLYQAELVGFLKSKYPNAKIEETRDYSRPDIIIDNIAIEIKGPTDMAGIKTLPDKINSYIPKRDYLIIVLFNIRIVYDEEKNWEIYNNKKQEILNNLVESKKEKVFFIEI